MADIDTISETYEPQIKTILQEISKEAKDRGYECSGPYEEHDEEYKWAMLIGPAGEEEEETGVDVSITIIESEVRGDDEGGVAFSLDVVGYEGEIIGGLTPYNYTPDVWVPMEDDEAVEARWRLFSHGIDASPVIDSIDEFMAKRVRAPASTQAQAPLSADLDTINRHRAKIGMRSLDPEVAGWGPEDVVAEARRIRALNPKPRVSFLEGAVSAVLTGLGVTGIVLGRRKR